MGLAVQEKEYQESELNVSTDFHLLSRQLQLPSRNPQKTHSGRKSGFALSNISLKSVIEYCKGEKMMHVGAAFKQPLRDIM